MNQWTKDKPIAEGRYWVATQGHFGRAEGVWFLEPVCVAQLQENGPLTAVSSLRGPMPLDQWAADWWQKVDEPSAP